MERLHNIIYMMICMIGFSCAKPVFFEKYQTIDNPWDKNKEYFFTCEIDDQSVAYNLSVHIRNNNLYPYQNLWLFLGEEQPGGHVVQDTIECMLADNYGKWAGTGISVYQLDIPIRTNFYFPQSGTYTFTIRQGMRDEQLKGIEQIGVRVEEIRN